MKLVGQQFEFDHGARMEIEADTQRNRVILCLGEEEFSINRDEVDGFCAAIHHVAEQLENL